MVRGRILAGVWVFLSLILGSSLLFLTATSSSAQTGQPDLVIHLYRDPTETDPFAPGNEITYQIYWVNWSNHPAQDGIVRVILPEYATYHSSSEPGFTLAQDGPSEVIWFKSIFSSFERGWLSLTVRVDDDAPVGAGVETLAEMWTLDRESNYGNNSSAVKEMVWPVEPDLQVTKHLWQNSAPIAAGSVITYEIMVWNRGGTAANSVRLTDTLPTDCAYASDDPAASGFTTTYTGPTVVWTKDVMMPTEYGLGPAKLYVHCLVASSWTPAQWLVNEIEISTSDDEFGHDNNASRWTYKPEADRRYGVAVDSLGDRTFRQASEAGFDYVLYYLDWSLTEPADNEYYWGNLDHAVWQAWRYNLRLVVRVDRAPAWVRGAGTETAPPGNPAKLGEFLAEAAGRWPRTPGKPDEPQVHGYVIWNEPNLAVEWGGNAPDAAIYAGLLQAAHNGIKAGSADAWVISAGLAPTGDDPPQAVDDRTYLQQIYAVPGVTGTFDYLGANPMGFASAPDDASDPNGFHFGRAEEWRAIMEANGDGAKDMFGTEAGWLRASIHDLGGAYNWMKVSGIDQSHYLARAYHKARCDWQRGDGTPWLGPMMTWNLDFAAGAYSQADHAYWFGLTDENRQPQRAYQTLQNAALRGAPDLWLEKELIDPLQLGQEFRYLIRYTNIGGQTAAGVSMTDTLPAGVEYASDSGGGTLQPSGDQVVWNLGNVYTCTYETITLTLRLPIAGVEDAYLSNRVEVNTMPGELYADDNAASASHPMPDLLAIDKTVLPARVGPGQSLTYTLAFSNTGQEVAYGVYISDAVPMGQISTLVYTRSGAVITPSGSISYSWQVEDLSPGEGGLITITAVISPDVSGTTVLTNRATISTTSEDLYWPNDSAVVSSTVDGEPPEPPELFGPADGTSAGDSTPDLIWNPSPSADRAGYLLNFEGVVQDVGLVTQTTTSLLADGTYTWTVAAYDSVGNLGPYAGVWAFAIDTQPPDPPVLQSPADGVTLTFNTATLTWLPSPSGDAKGHLLKINDVILDVGPTTRYTTGALAHGPYTWTVAAYDAANNTGAFTDTWTFFVDATPLPPALLSPGNHTALADDTPTLSWRPSPSPDTTGYVLGWGAIHFDVGSATHHTMTALADGVYTWTVAAYNSTGLQSPFTDTWTLMVDTIPPEPPMLSEPGDSVFTSSTSLTLTWLASPSADAAGYLCKLGGLAHDVSNTRYYSTGLLADGAYTWTAAAYDAAGNTSAYTASWSFTLDSTPPAAPRLASPEDGTLTDSAHLTLTWQPSISADAAGYRLDFGGTLHDLGSATQYDAGLLADGAYTWTVAAYDALSNTSAYTTTWGFTVDTVAPAPPALLCPANGTILADNTPSLHWNASSGRSASSGWRGTSSTGTVGYVLNLAGVEHDVGSATGYTSSILADGAYTWTVAAYDALGHTSAYTGAWFFVVDTVSPHVVAVSPGHGAGRVDVTAPLVITFSRPIEASSLVWAALPDPGGWKVTWSASATVATLTHSPYGYWQTHSLTVTAASDLVGNPLAGAPVSWSFATGPYQVHLPLVIKRDIKAPDLVVERIGFSSTDLQLVLKNQGSAPARQDFWVDVYVDPEPIPSAVNQIWPHLCEQGLVWGVTKDLQPGEILTLTTGGDYYAGDYSHVNWPLPAGTSVYAQVDSASEGSASGAVHEDHEISGEFYNNISGPVVAVDTGRDRQADSQSREIGSGAVGSLPPRR